MKNRKIVALSGSVVFLIALILPSVAGCKPAPTVPPESEVITLTSIRSYPIDHRLNVGYREYIKLMSEKSKGRVVIKDLGGSEAYPLGQQIEVVSKGVVDMLNGPAYWGGYIPEVEAVFHTFGATPMFLRKIGMLDFYDKLFREKLGVAVLGLPSYIRFVIFLKKPIRTLDDLKGLRLRTVAGAYTSVVEGLGASPVGVPPTDMYSALERGLVDGVCFPLQVSDLGVADVAKYVVFPPFWVCTDYFLCINASKLDGLPADAKKLVVSTAEDLDRNTVEVWNKEAMAEWKVLQQKGVQAITISDEEWLRVQKMNWDAGMARLKQVVTSPENYTALEQFCLQTYPPKKEVMKLPWQ